MAGEIKIQFLGPIGILDKLCNTSTTLRRTSTGGVVSFSFIYHNNTIEKLNLLPVGFEDLVAKKFIGIDTQDHPPEGSIDYCLLPAGFDYLTGIFSKKKD